MPAGKSEVYSVLYIAYSAIFLAASYLQFRNSPSDSFVLLTISLIFAIAAFKSLKPSGTHGEVYALSASVIAVVFACLSLLSALASSMVLLISHKPVVLAFESQLGVVGFITLPYLVSRTRVRN